MFVFYYNYYCHFIILTDIQFQIEQYCILSFTGDCKRDFNPTHYRSSAFYNHLMASVTWSESGENSEKSYGFDTVLSKTVQTYIKVLVI